MNLPLSKTLSNQDLSAALHFISGVLALQGANPFRVRAYDNAATVIGQYDDQLHQLYQEHYDLSQIPGIGKTLAAKLKELFTTGTISAFNNYTAEIPAGTYPVSHIHGLGVKKAYKLCDHFQLDDPETAIKKLFQLAKDGQIRTLAGFGEKSEEELIEMIEHHNKSERIPYLVAHQIATDLVNELRRCENIEKIEIMGSLRRQSKTIGDIDIGFTSNDIGRVKTYVNGMKSVKRVVVAGNQLIRIQLTSNHQVDIKLAPASEWGSFLQHFTGSKEHNIKLRELALSQGKSLSEHGIKLTNQNHDQVKFTDEKKFYNYLGLDWIPPQQRIGAKEIEQAKQSSKSK
jgi:DNA polymerase (family X)